MSFERYFGVTPDLAPRQVGAKLGVSHGPSNNNPRISETDSRDPETETGSFKIEETIHRIHGTLETGLQIMLRTLVAPTRGTWQIWLYIG